MQLTLLGTNRVRWSPEVRLHHGAELVQLHTCPVYILTVAERQPIVPTITAPRTLNVLTLPIGSGYVLFAILEAAMIVVDALLLERDI
jgi:hypothetical protein